MHLCGSESLEIRIRTCRLPNPVIIQKDTENNENNNNMNMNCNYYIDLPSFHNSELGCSSEVKEVQVPNGLDNPLECWGSNLA